MHNVLNPSRLQYLFAEHEGFAIVGWCMDTLSILANAEHSGIHTPYQKVGFLIILAHLSFALY